MHVRIDLNLFRIWWIFKFFLFFSWHLDSFFKKKCFKLSKKDISKHVFFSHKKNFIYNLFQHNYAYAPEQGFTGSYTVLTCLHNSMFILRLHIDEQQGQKSIIHLLLCNVIRFQNIICYKSAMKSQNIFFFLIHLNAGNPEKMEVHFGF